MESLHNQLEEKKTLIRPTDIAIAFSAFLVFVLVKFVCAPLSKYKQRSFGLN